MASESESQVTIVITEVTEKLNKLSSNNAACIYTVPQKLRKANEAAYTPRLVSIGPLHRGLDKLQAMEACKLRFLNNFLTRFGIGLNTLVHFAEENESSVRGYYEETIQLSSKKFIEMILFDGIFIVELFLENHFFELRDKNEMVFRNNWMYKDLLHDLLLLENQLPITTLNGLLDFVDFPYLHQGIVKLTIYDLAHKFFKDVGNTKKISLTEPCYKAKHFVHFLLILHAPKKPKQHPVPRKNRAESSATRSATELQEAGVNFVGGEGNCFFDINFDNGKLKIPRLIVNDTTETFFRNLIAFEQCGYSGYYSEDITSYVILIDRFINTTEDVELLVKHEIIKNKLGESQKVANLFNNLYKEVVDEANIFYFDDVCQKLNEYSRNRLHEWKAKCFTWRVMLKRDYFSNPWSFISVVAAIVLLILTVVQTVCSILQV